MAEHSVRFLIVDDSLVPRKILKKLISGMKPNYLVDIAKSGEEGIEMAKNQRKHGNNYDLVFMDQDMKDTFKPERATEDFQQLQGHDAVEIMRKLNMKFPIVMRTSSCSYKDLARYYTSGADAVLPKSIPAKKVVKSLLFVEGAMKRQLQISKSVEGFILLSHRAGLESQTPEQPVKKLIHSNSKILSLDETSLEDRKGRHFKRSLSTVLGGRGVKVIKSSSWPREGSSNRISFKNFQDEKAKRVVLKQQERRDLIVNNFDGKLNAVYEENEKF